MLKMTGQGGLTIKKQLLWEMKCRSAWSANVHSWTGNMKALKEAVCTVLLLSDVADNVYWSRWPKVCRRIFQGKRKRLWERPSVNKCCLNILPSLFRAVSIQERVVTEPKMQSAAATEPRWWVNQRRRAFPLRTKSPFVPLTYGLTQRCNLVYSFLFTNRFK